MNPHLTQEQKRLLKLRARINKHRPAFKRQEWFRYVRLGESWRRPKGKHSKQREHRGYRPPIVDSGYRGPKLVRYLHPSGYRDVLVYNVQALDSLDPQKDAIRIARTVGSKKKRIIESEALKRNFKVLNSTTR